MVIMQDEKLDPFNFFNFWTHIALGRIVLLTVATSGRVIHVEMVLTRASAEVQVFFFSGALNLMRSFIPTTQKTDFE